jgi:hypothetical protein
MIRVECQVEAYGRDGAIERVGIVLTEMDLRRLAEERVLAAYDVASCETRQLQAVVE